MATIQKLIKAVLDFTKKTPEQLLAQGYTILKALTGNVNFPNPPLDLAVFKTLLDAFSVAIGDAKDGSKKAITTAEHRQCCVSEKVFPRVSCQFLGFSLHLRGNLVRSRSVGKPGVFGELLWTTATSRPKSTSTSLDLHRTQVRAV